MDPEGHILGRHKGIIHYTIGQRRGLGVSGGRPLYVKEIRPEDNTVVLADDCGLYERTAIATDFNWIALEAPVSPIRVQARARYHQPEQAATATVLPDGRVQVTFDRPQRALTKGQAIVLYQGDVVLGGGTIQEIQTMDTSALLKGRPCKDGSCAFRFGCRFDLQNRLPSLLARQAHRS